MPCEIVVFTRSEICYISHAKYSHGDSLPNSDNANDQSAIQFLTRLSLHTKYKIYLSRSCWLKSRAARHSVVLFTRRPGHWDMLKLVAVARDTA